MADQDAFQKALAEARAKAAKFREEGKLPPEDPNAKKIKHFVAPKGSQQSSPLGDKNIEILAWEEGRASSLLKIVGQAGRATEADLAAT